MRKDQNHEDNAYTPIHNAPRIIPNERDFFRPTTSEKYPVGISKSTTEIENMD